MRPPEVTPEPDWQEFELPYDIASGRSMFVETENGPTIRMRFFRRGSDGALVGRVWFGQATFGPPGHAHGGLVAFVADEAMGACAWLGGYPSVAANIDVDFLQMTPLGQDCFIESRILSVEPRKVVVEARLVLEGRTLVESRGVFVRISKQKMIEFSRNASLEVPDLSGFEFAPPDRSST